MKISKDASRKACANKLVANVLLAKCKQSKRLFGITIEQVDAKNWEMKYSYGIDEGRAKSEGFDKTSINADCYAANSYPGCPFCHSMGFVKCSKCGKLTCWENERSLVCSWCNELMDNIAYTGPMDISVGAD